MTPKQEAALRQALEALEVATTPLAKDRQEVLRARAAIREALAEQPAQQQAPVAWYDEEYDCAYTAAELDGGNVDGLLPLYTSPPASKPWVGLTQQDIDIAFDDTQEGGVFDEFARAIEAKLREKNA